MLILTHRDVQDALRGQEVAVLRAVEDAYIAHAAGGSSLPHSVFLRFPDEPRNRIIALPAYLGGEQPIAGIKWISSFPANIDRGLERASAAVILNSLETGRPLAFLEGSTISAWRTAAGAALAARLLPATTDGNGVTVLGCGVINFAILRFLHHVVPGLTEVTAYDTQPGRAERLRERCAADLPDLTVRVEHDLATALAKNTLVSVATNALQPHLDFSGLVPGTLILHVSLRDVLPEAIVTAVNVVDDLDHVFRANTSVHLAEQQVGNRDFVAATIGELAARGAAADRDPSRITVVSPFGLGILDLAVASLVVATAKARGLGTAVDNFLPTAETNHD
ncbi:MAG: 2,3-diaminopropionate biosynthesis protein SbnB [Hamadaea sp.]|nr:2,3-diaminopropionate biosynthesis protein SbnB [Hamadaea sp.]NUT04529.1 2,3-diaminopropionate biosynthesis protein SbnB [Hamadaea sp.]